MALFRPFDTIIIGALLVAAVASFGLLKGETGARAEVFLGSHKVAQFNLRHALSFKSIDTRIGKIKLEYGDGGIRVVESPCNQKICILQGVITKTHEHIICLPANMSVSIVNEAQPDTSFDAIDAISY